jgi:hypothetical protein
MALRTAPADRLLQSKTIGAARSFRKNFQDNDSGPGSPRLSLQIDGLAHDRAQDGKVGAAMIKAKASAASPLHKHSNWKANSANPLASLSGRRDRLPLPRQSSNAGTSG